MQKLIRFFKMAPRFRPLALLQEIFPFFLLLNCTAVVVMDGGRILLKDL